MEIPTIQVPSSSRFGLNSVAKREASRVRGRLPETIYDEECDKCGRPFVPLESPTGTAVLCRRCRGGER